MAKDGYEKPAATGLAAGLNKGFIVTRRPLKTKPSYRKGKRGGKVGLIREVVREVVGFAPYERRMIELLKIGSAATFKRALKLAKKRLGTHRRGKKKRDEMTEATFDVDGDEEPTKWPVCEEIPWHQVGPLVERVLDEHFGPEPVQKEVKPCVKESHMPQGKIMLWSDVLEQSGDVQQLLKSLREFLRNIEDGDEAACVLAGARHALLACRGAGRPSVCDALLLTKPGVPVLVDWRRKGSEGHFQYGPEGFDLWSHLFEPNKRCRSAETLQCEDGLTMPGRINCLFMNMLRGYLWSMPEHDLQHLRLSYAAAISELEPTMHIKKQLMGICREWTEEWLNCTRTFRNLEDVGPTRLLFCPDCQDTYVLGVHRRLACSEMVACQLSQRAPSNVEYISRARKLCAASGKKQKIIFLATDDSVREDGVDNEVHRNPCAEADAEDALVDALCLAKCEELICVDSNLSIFAALKNPRLRLHALSSILPEGWEEDAAQPEEPVHESYEACNKQKFDEAIEAWKSAASTARQLAGKKAKDLWVTLMCEAASLEKNNSLHASEATTSLVLQEVPEHLPALRCRGLVREQLGDLHGSRQDLSRAAAQNFMDLEVQDTGCISITPMARSETTLDLEDLASRYDTQDGGARPQPGEDATDQATLPDIYDLRSRCFRRRRAGFATTYEHVERQHVKRIRALLVVNFLAYWSTASYCGYSFYLRVEEIGTKAMPPMEVALACVFLLGTQATLELAAAVCLTQPVRLGQHLRICDWAVCFHCAAATLDWHVLQPGPLFL
eukprot:g10144.t1